jgi:hypothetical protein
MKGQRFHAITIILLQSRYCKQMHNSNLDIRDFIYDTIHIVSMSQNDWKFMVIKTPKLNAIVCNC